MLKQDNDGPARPCACMCGGMVKGHYRCRDRKKPIDYGKLLPRLFLPGHNRYRRLDSRLVSDIKVEEGYDKKL